jgi:3-hydroxy acid dehydrogenase / malonic semialdehyde reductase
LKIVYLQVYHYIIFGNIKEMNRIALITGVTSGIGLAIANKLAENGYDLIITGRRGPRIHRIAGEISGKNQNRILPLVFDVRDLTAVEEAIGKLPHEWRQIDLLVNNAGLAVGLNPIQDGVIDDWERMIDTNVKGLLYITRMIAPMMIERGSGHIINIGSIAGKEVYLNGNVYCGTKFAVDAITRGMRIDMVKHGIKVSSVHPGMVETEFSIVRFKGDRERADSVYKGITPLFAEDIAEAVHFLITRPPHVNIDDLVIMPTCQASATVVHRS